MQIPKKLLTVPASPTPPVSIRPFSPTPSTSPPVVNDASLKLLIPNSHEEKSNRWVGSPKASENSTYSFINQAKRLEPESFPDKPTSQSSNPPSTLPNIRHLICSYGIGIRYNTITKKTEFHIPSFKSSPDNADNTAYTIIQSLAILNSLSVTNLQQTLEAIGDMDPHNPVADWILMKVWDKTDRLQPFYETLIHREDYPIELKQILLRRWLISLVAAALSSEGFHARGVLTLQGPQSIGKTSWIKKLVSSASLAEKIIKLDHHLDANNKDSIITALSHWIVEIGELDSSFKKDIARLKGFITASEDKLRRPYAKGNSNYQRRTVFCATVNDENFLVDTTGNTRWWTIPVTKIDYQHNIDMQQLFAQVAELYASGEPWWLEKNEEILLEIHNQSHCRVSLLREQLIEILDLDRVGEDKLPAMTANEILQKLDVRNPSQSTFKECHSLLKEYLGNPKKINGNMKYRVPLKSYSPVPELPKPQLEEDIY